MKVRDMAQVVFRAEPDIKAWLEKKAQQEERSQNWLIGKALREAMQRDEQIEQA
jgi:predicted transcriptional regulator